MWTKFQVKYKWLEKQLGFVFINIYSEFEK